MAGGCHESLLDPDACPKVKALKARAKERLFTAHPKVKRELAGREALDALLKRFARTVCPLRKAGWNAEQLRREDPHSWRLLNLMNHPVVRDPDGLKLHHSDYDTLHMITDFIAGQTARFAIDLWRSLGGMDA